MRGIVDGRIVDLGGSVDGVVPRTGSGVGLWSGFGCTIDLFGSEVRQRTGESSLWVLFEGCVLLRIETVITSLVIALVLIVADSRILARTSIFHRRLLSVTMMGNHYNSYWRELLLVSSEVKVMVTSPDYRVHKNNSPPVAIVVEQAYSVQSSLDSPFPSPQPLVPRVQQQTSDPQDDDTPSLHNCPSHPPATAVAATTSTPHYRPQPTYTLPANTPSHSSATFAAVAHMDGTRAWISCVVELPPHSSLRVVPVDSCHTSDSMADSHTPATQLFQPRNEACLKGRQWA